MHVCVARGSVASFSSSYQADLGSGNMFCGGCSGSLSNNGRFTSDVFFERITSLESRKT